MSIFLTLLAGGYLAHEFIKEARQPFIPAEYFRNKDLIYEDRVVKCMPFKQYMTNLENGKYYLPDVPPDAVIDNMEQYKKDSEYDFMKAYKAAQKGKYAKDYDPYAKIREKYGNVSDTCAYWMSLLEPDD
mgnify:CR=1 FL=1